MFASNAITEPRVPTGTIRPAQRPTDPAANRLAKAAPMAPASLIAIAARATETKAEDPARLLWLATLMSFHAIDLAFDGHAHRSQDTQSLADALRREVGSAHQHAGERHQRAQDGDRLDAQRAKHPLDDLKLGLGQIGLGGQPQGLDVSPHLGDVSLGGEPKGLDIGLGGQPQGLNVARDLGDVGLGGQPHGLDIGPDGGDVDLVGQLPVEQADLLAGQRLGLLAAEPGRLQPLGVGEGVEGHRVHAATLAAGPAQVEPSARAGQ